MSFHPNLKQLRNSKHEDLHRCPRFFELVSLTPPDEDEGDAIDLIFGATVGFGIQEILQGETVQKTWFKMFLKWRVDLFAFEDSPAKKSFFHAMLAVEKFVGFQKLALTQYKLATFDGKPAVELAILLDLGDGFTERQHIDAVLVDKNNNTLCVMESKTTKFKQLNEAAYKNSNQALGYGVSLDAIINSLADKLELGASYKVLYPIWKTAEGGSWDLFEFPKGFTKRALWINDVILDKKRIMEYALDNYFPMYGSWDTCYRFFRPCRFFGICEMSNEALGLGNAAEMIEGPENYQYHFKLIDLIEAQLAKHEE